MENRKLPALFAVAGVVVAVALFLILKDDTADEGTELASSEPSHGAAAENGGEHKQGGGGKDEMGDSKQGGGGEPAFEEIQLRGGQPLGGVQELEFTEGEQIRIRVTSDEFAHVHFHGYDVFQDAEPGSPAEFNVEADVGGVFEIEEENTAVQIAEVSVVPG